MIKFLFYIYPVLLGALFLISPQKRWLRLMLNLIKGIGSSFLVLILLKLYVLDIYKIPSESMEQTLSINDKIIILKNKKPKNNEMAVFDMKHWKDPMIIVKRCIGTPGDTIELRQDSVFVNGTHLKDPQTVQHQYRLDSILLDTKEIHQTLEKQPHIWRKDKQQFIALTEQEFERLTKDITWFRATRTTKKPWDNGNAYPWKWYLKSNWNNIKPFYIPRKQTTVALDRNTIAWYTDIIKLENENAQIKDNIVMIDSIEIKEYTFKNNYYYMMGDNRDQSLDSRWWGFAPEDCLAGKVICTIKPFK